MKSGTVKDIVVGSVIGTAMAVAGYTFIYAKGASYMTNDPKACANCHVMQGHYDGWVKSSHRSVAVCNDCHTPPGFFPKYFTKAENGFWHSFAFTTGRYPDEILMHERNRKVTERACRKCHVQIVSDIEAHGGTEQLSCIRCHRSVGHLE
jgi:cytochrome c nitrite reductase small subunit